jgi:heavy metal translocating P-type ATPase
LTPSIEIRSRIPGRIRFWVPALYRRQDYKNKIEFYLRREPGVKKVSANPNTGRVLVLFDPGVEEGRLALKILSSKWQEPVQKISEEDEIQGLPVAETILSGSTLAALTLKQVLAGKSPLTTDYAVLYLSSAVSMIAGYPILKKGVSQAVKKGGINYELVMGAATFITLVLRESLWGLAVVFLLNLSTVIQEIAVRRAEKLYRVFPEKQMPYLKTDIMPGDTFTAGTGDMIIADGRVVKGEAVVDESILTGEYMPRFKNEQQHVLAGTRVMSGEIKVMAERSGRDTRMGELLSMHDNYLDAKTAYGEKGERLAEKITPFALVTSGVVFACSRDFLRVLAILLSASPRACTLAGTLPVKLGVARAAREGIIVKRPASLEKLADIDVVFFDKTGTLTEASPVVSRVLPMRGYSADFVVKTAASLETGSVHPLASAILKEARIRNITPVPPSVSREVAGNGIKGFTDGQKIIVGSHDFMVAEGVDISDSLPKARRIQHYGESEVYVAKEGRLIGLIGIRDTLKSAVSEMIHRLYKRGIARVGIISGDSSQAVKRIAESCGIDLIESSLSPEEKAEIIKSYKRQGHKVAVIGDGINDIPAMAASDASICFGRGLLRVEDFADIAILNNDMENIPKSIIISRKMQHVATRNLAMAAGANIAGIALSALKIIDPFFAAVYYNLNSLAVLINSMGVLNMKI